MIDHTNLLQFVIQLYWQYSVYTFYYLFGGTVNIYIYIYIYGLLTSSVIQRPYVFLRSCRRRCHNVMQVITCDAHIRCGARTLLPCL